MKTADFFHHFHDNSNKNGYSFFFDEKPLEAPPQMSSNQQLLVNCLNSLSRLSLGLPLLFQPAIYKSHNKETLTGDFKRLQKYCDLIGIKDSFGSCLLRTAIVADEISDEALVGRLAIIHEQASNFQKYTANPMGTRRIFGSGGMSVRCLVFLIFSSHKRAREFSEKPSS
jgi:hypothetical protein